MRMIDFAYWKNMKKGCFHGLTSPGRFANFKFYEKILYVLFAVPNYQLKSLQAIEVHPYGVTVSLLWRLW